MRCCPSCCPEYCSSPECLGWAGAHVQIGLMTDHITSPKFKRYDQVPDPYYGGSSGFELVLDLLDDACSGLLANIQKQRGQ